MRRIIGLIGILALPALVAAAPLPRFTQPTAIWNVDVSNATLRGNSGLMMTHLAAFSSLGWGDDRNIDFQIDFSFYVLHGNASTPTHPIVAFPNAIEYYSPDCEDPGFAFPVPPIGGIEGTDPPAYSCNAGSDDCHLLVVNDTTKVLYEAYSTQSANASGVHAICGLKWDLTRTYPRYGRGEHCTSADGAGFPIAPLLFNADDVWTAAQAHGDLGHAIRFILGNNRMMEHKYVHPASHGTTATSDTNPNAVPYGSRLKLKQSFNVNAFSTNEAVRAVLRTLQKYGMFLSDGGGIPLTAEADTFTTHKWGDADVDIDSHSFFGIRPTDFDVVEAGDPMTVTYDCERTPDDFIFIDSYDF
jgi:serine/threonine-protein kinase